MCCLFPKFLLFFLVTFQSFVWETISFQDNTPTAYEILKVFNFPSGLLPVGVTGYNLDPLSGNFSAFLNGTCSFTLEGAYKLRFKSSISGILSDGRLVSVEGISLKFVFLWFNVVQVLRKGDELEFSVGFAATGFSMDNFEDSPQCDCRFLKCKNQNVSKIGGMTSV